MAHLKTIYQLKTPEGLDALIQRLRMLGYKTIGPTIQDRAIALTEIKSSTDLPRGMVDLQEKGTYRLEKREGDQGFFGYNLGPGSWKSFLFPERRQLWRLTKDSDPEPTASDSQSFAFIGVRACELAAIKIQDRVFIRENGDPHYERHRKDLFIVGVHCRTAAATCFCPSMGTGPEFPEGWDLLLTEINNDLLIEAGTEKGRNVLSTLPVTLASGDAGSRIKEQLDHTASLIIRKMDQTNIKETIYESITSHNWEDVASRCLSCANCTMVCPTCFCSTVEDISDVEGVHAERWQKWDSCFHIDFSYTHGGSRRQTTASRYRQWFTHKLATWHDQFQTSGCVGCGRCIAWCPVGIDLTEEMALIRGKTPDSGKDPTHDR